MTKMKKKTDLNLLPPLLFAPKDKNLKYLIYKLLKQKKIRKIGPRLYTSVKKNEEEIAVKGGWRSIISELYPSAQLSFRSAIEFKPDENNYIYLTSGTNKILKLPGLSIQFIRGEKPLDDDLIVAGIKVSSLHRALLENLSVTKKSLQKGISKNEIELKLEDLLRVYGEQKLIEIRESAKKIAPKLKFKKEFKILNNIIGALLGTQDSKYLKTELGKSRWIGMPYDSTRLVLFETLFSELINLQNIEKEGIAEKIKSHQHFKNKAFFESYFSNYIEGTTFDITEAEEIVFDKKIIQKRIQDSHDILSCFNIVSDPNEMILVPSTSTELLDFLKIRHKKLMAQRPDVNPGHFKTKPNRAGDTYFVSPELVIGTLTKGFELYEALPKGLLRAIYMLFLISEVHPFIDGNGRLARVMMNAEFQSQGLSTVIIPTVYREDYLGALRALTRRSRPEILIKMIAQAHRFSNLDFSEYRKILKYIESKNWFLESDEATIILK